MLIKKKDSSTAEKNFSIGAQIQVSIVPQVKVKGIPHTTAQITSALKLPRKVITLVRKLNRFISPQFYLYWLETSSS